MLGHYDKHPATPGWILLDCFVGMWWTQVALGGQSHEMRRWLLGREGYGEDRASPYCL